MATDPATCPTCEIHAESVFRVDGMDCHEEVSLLERRLGRLVGLEALAADLVGRRLTVTHDAARLSTSTILEAVAQTGMQARLEHEQPVGPLAFDRSRRWAVIISGASLVIGIALQLAEFSFSMFGPAYGLAMLSGGVYTARRALGSIRSRVVDINVLMTIAVVGALSIGEWAEAATVVFLFALAQWLESASLERVRGAVRSLMDCTPVEAHVRRDGTEQRVGVDAVAVGESLLIRPGERISLDGIVRGGSSLVNQAPITGESIPVEKFVGTEVFAGTINGHGALEVEVTRRRTDTTLARIIHLVERAQAQRAPSQTLVDRFAHYYMPVVVALAITVAVVPPLALGDPFSGWVYRALVLLVISCPCALVISTPVSIVSALAAAAKQGVLIKGGVHLERAASADCIAFDKTGTLTKGRMTVLGVEPTEGETTPAVLATAAALESRSEHPIARAILQRAGEAGIVPKRVTAFQALPGLGAEAVVGNVQATIGNHRLFEERRLCTPDVHARLAAMAQRGWTAVLVARSSRTIGLIAVADSGRESAADTVAALRHQGVGHLALLTGDHESAARGVCDDLGLDEYRSDLLPEDKVSAVQQLRQRHHTVVMVGDGVNDAPALAAADVGIAMGVAGSDAALETADVALMADDLMKIPYVVRLGRATVRNIKTNIAFSLGLKVAFLALALTGVATLWMAVVADMGASLVVIANGLRLLRTT